MSLANFHPGTERLLDISEDENTISETPMDLHRDSPATFSRNWVDRLGIIGHNSTGIETVNPHENQNVTNDEVSPSNSDVVSCD